MMSQNAAVPLSHGTKTSKVTLLGSPFKKYEVI